MSKGFDMLRDYIEHDALAMRRRKCCELEYELQQEFAQLKAENAELRELVRDIYDEYRYLRVRFHRIYVQHEERMRAIERRMSELGVEVER